MLLVEKAREDIWYKRGREEAKPFVGQTFTLQFLTSDDFHSSVPSHNLTFICKKDRIGRDGPDSSSDRLAMGRRTFVSLSDAVLEGRQDVGGGKDGDGDGEGVADL